MARTARSALVTLLLLALLLASAYVTPAYSRFVSHRRNLALKALSLESDAPTNSVQVPTTSVKVEVLTGSLVNGVVVGAGVIGEGEDNLTEPLPGGENGGGA
ncbi:unnamed protein product [Closterium sp. Yama58-4]|nr:unnamed protein product [Closterium sp. Yama58-4]